jgi:hypothetical protein
MMNDKLGLTKSLGDAVLARQPDVMNTIQRLRAKAQANNKADVSPRSRRSRSRRLRTSRSS